jgi:hypothetical protein
MCVEDSLSGPRLTPHYIVKALPQFKEMTGTKTHLACRFPPWAFLAAYQISSGAITSSLRPWARK